MESITPASYALVIMSTPAQWLDKDARELVLSSQVPSDSFVCRLCTDDVARVLENPSHVSKWRKKQGQSKCCISTCNKTVFVATRIASSEIMKSVIESTDLQSRTDEIPIYYIYG